MCLLRTCFFRSPLDLAVFPHSAQAYVKRARLPSSVLNSVMKESGSACRWFPYSPANMPFLWAGGKKCSWYEASRSSQDNYWSQYLFRRMFTASVFPKRISGLRHKATVIALKSPRIEVSGLHVSLGIARKIKALATHWTGEATTCLSNHKALDVIIQAWKLNWSFIAAL